MRCNECGHNNLDEAKYCVECGSPLDPPPASEVGSRGLYIAVAALSVVLAALSIALVVKTGIGPNLEPVDGPSSTSPANDSPTTINPSSVSPPTHSGGSEPSPNPKQDATWDDAKQLTCAFVRAWYNDWSLDGDNRRDNAQSVQERCRPMVGESSELYQQLGGSSLGKAAYSSRKDAATCVVEDPRIENSDQRDEDAPTFRVSIRYTSDAEPNWSGDSSSYGWLAKNRVHEVSWDVTTDSTGQTVTALALVPRGPYRLAGVVNVHEENLSNKKVSVVSVELDEPVHFLYEYKGTYEGDAQKVLLANSQSDAYEEWAQYDGRRITVECDGLQGANHDASSLNVDALATGDIRLVEAEEPSKVNPVPATAEVVHLDGCDFVVPKPWVGKVVQGERYEDITLEWNGFYMLYIRQCPPSEFPKTGPVEESHQLDNGASVDYLTGDDFAVVAEVTYGEGKGVILYFNAYSFESVNFFHRSEEDCREYLALQAAVAGRSTDEDPMEIARARLKVCVDNLKFTE